MEISEIRNSPKYLEAYATYIRTGNPAECRTVLLSENAPASGQLPVPDMVESTIKTAWERTEFLNTRTPVPDTPIWLRLTIDGRRSRFSYSLDGENYQPIGRVFDTTKFSDEFCKYGEFTGTMVGITCADKVFHRKCADFDFFEMVTLRSPVDIND